MTRLGAVILAAGRSTRLGEHKPLAKIGGVTLLERAAQLFRRAGVERAVAVAGCRAEETRAEADRIGVACAVNPDYDRGMLSSVQAGLAALPAGLEAVFVLPVDVPLVRPHTLTLLARAFAGGGSAVLHPVFDGRRGHPPLIGAELLPGILAWDGPDGLAGALAAIEASQGAFGATDVPVADAGIHFDVDTPDDLVLARRLTSRTAIPTVAEAYALLDLYQAGERGLAHARGVAACALAMARALAATGAKLDLELTESAALLHDIAKGQKGHEAAGAALLDSLEFGAAARIVAAHRDIAPEDAPAITERELVYLGDKLVFGDRRVSIEARFQEKLDRFAFDAEATAAIRRRLSHALAMRRRIEEAAGATLETILGRAAT